MVRLGRAARRDLFALCAGVNACRSALLARIRSDLPILITSGDADPLAEGGSLLQQLGQWYRDAGFVDVTVKLYPAARHEILNETNLYEVTGDIAECLRAR